MSPLIEEAEVLRTRYDEEPSHSDHVAVLALQLFDGLLSWHQYGVRERELLHTAALLHDIGWSQTPDGRGHHKWSARLIHRHAWKTLLPAEVPAVAQIARYHRKAIPQADHAEFHALPEPRQCQVRILGGILRLADALDRTHSRRIQRLKITGLPDNILVQVVPTGPWEAERAMFELKRDLLEQIAERPVLCEELKG